MIINKKTNKISEFSSANLKIFSFTAIAYLSLHSIRTGWSYVKVDFQNSSDFSSYFIGTLDLLFLISYAVGLFINGSLGDRVDLKIFLIICLIGTTASMMIFSFFGFLSFYSPIMIVLCFIGNGFFQSIVNKIQKNLY